VKKISRSVTVLVLNFNGRTYLKQCLDSLLTTDYPNFKIIVIDNGSVDGSVEFVRSNYPNVQVIKHNRNYGYACAYNRVIDAVQSEYVALVNNDILVDPSWLRELVSYADNDDIAALTPKMKFLHDKTRINAAGGNCDLYGVGWNKGNGEVDMGQYDAVQEVFYGNGGALLIKKSVWREVGSFDERYFIYGEDLDWCWRARLKGYKIIYVPYAEVRHHWRGSEVPMVYSLERHWFSTVLKNYSLKTLIQLMPKYLALKALKAIWLIARAESREKLTVFKAILWNLSNLRESWKKRIQIQMSRTATDWEIQKHMFKGSFELSIWLKKLKHPILEYYRRG